MRTAADVPQWVQFRRPVRRTAPGQGQVVGSPLSTLLLCVLILTTQFGPTLPVYLGLVSSRAIGMVAAAAVITLIMALWWSLSVRNSRRSILDTGAAGILLVIVTVCVIIFHGVVADVIQKLDFARFVESFVPLGFLLAAGIFLGCAFCNVSANQLHTASWVSFWSFMVIIILRISRLEPPGVTHNNPTFPFTEVSYFALAFGPILLYRSVTAPPDHRIWWVFFGLGLAIVMKNATLAGFALGTALICRRLLNTLGIIALPLLAGAASQLTYFTSRMDISSHSSSISAMVYLQGWELLAHSLTVSKGWGIGFQQLGVRHANLLISQLIRNGNRGVALNLEDGSFLLSKFGSEFGMLGIALIIGYCMLCLRCIRSLRSFTRLSRTTLLECVIVAFGVDVFIRGINYFYDETLLFIGAITAIYLYKMADNVVETLNVRKAQEGSKGPVNTPAF